MVRIIRKGFSFYNKMERNSSNNGYTGSEDSASVTDEDLILTRCPYYIKEQVDCLDKNDRWRNGEIIRVSFSMTGID
jgi:hypothetical protein